MRFRKLVKQAACCALMVCAVPLLSTWARGALMTATGVDQPSASQNALNQCVFGQPTINGNSLQFPNFVLQSSSTPGQLNPAPISNIYTMALTATAAIQSIDFRESGNYFLSSIGGASPSASVNLVSSIAGSTPPNAGSYVQVLGPGNVVIGTVFPTSGDWTVSAALGGGGTPLSSDWSRDLVFNLSAFPNATSVNVVLKNDVTVQSNNAIAYIGGTSTAVTMGVTLVPEPSSILLLSMGALFVVFAGKRKIASR